MNENLHVYCPKCGSEVALADENGKTITPKSGDFFLRLKDNDPEKAKKLKDVINAMYGNDVEVKNVGSVEESNTEQHRNPFEKIRHKEEDEIEKSIMEDGDINSKFLWRRWIMSQVLRHYKTADGDENFHNYFIKSKSMCYVFKTCIAEAKALSNLSGTELEERKLFFNGNVFVQIVRDYFAQYNKEISEKLKTMDLENRQIVLKKGFGAKLEDTFVIGKKAYKECDIAEIQRRIQEFMRTMAMFVNDENYKDMAKTMSEIYRTFPPFKHCKKSKAWMDAFKGAGAFYTLDNLLRWHSCTIRDEDTNKVYSGDHALKYLRDTTKKMDHNEYYKLYAIMKRVVEENNFNFSKRMKEIRDSEAA